MHLSRSLHDHARRVEYHSLKVKMIETKLKLSVKRKLFLGVLCFLFILSITDKSSAQDYHWQKSDSTCALIDGNKIVWQLNFSKSQDKPYFHPLRVQEKNLTMERPADHGHHRGLWFAWKYINKVNYWEEEPSGVSRGRSKIINVDLKLSDKFSAEIEFDLDYGPEGDKVVLKEHRILKISAPDKSGSYIIDWSLNFNALEVPLLLDCTPTLKRNGVDYGGYAGLGYRGDNNMSNSIFTASNGWTNKDDLTGYGENGDWMDITSNLGNSNGPIGGVTIFDHPKNPRHPSPWYIWYGAGKHVFFMPAFLYNEPFELGARQTLNLKYRVYVHANRLDVKKSNQLFKEFKDY